MLSEKNRLLYNGNETAIYLYENFGYKKIPDNILPISPGRSNSGRMTLRTNKNPINKKRAL